jgi:polygalacturonase
MTLRLLILLAALLYPISGLGSATVDITTHGAVGDGKTLNTKAIQAAVDQCAAHGGGTIVVPAGTFLTGTVELKSNITLSLSPGAILRGSSNIDDYPPVPFRHNELGEVRSLLWAIGQPDLRITGSGVIDLNDAAFIDFSQYRSDPGMASGVDLDEAQRQETVASHARPRPTQPLFFRNCQRVRIDGVTIRNAPCWTITLAMCRDVKLSHLTIDNNLRTPNCDGIHCCACKDVIITDSLISAGDDCIALTCITDWDEVCENVVVANCIMTSRSAAIRIGHEASKVRNVNVSNIIVNDTNRGIAIFVHDRGWVENVRIDNALLQTRFIAGGWWGKGEPLVLCARGSGRIEGIAMSNVRAESENSILVVGQEMNIRDVKLRDWSFKLKYGRNRPLFKPLYELSPAPNLAAPDPARQIPWLFASDVQGLRAAHVRCARADGEPDFAIDPITRTVDELEFEHCHPTTQPVGKP